MLHTQIKDEMKKAMLARDQVRVTTLRGLMSAFVSELVAKRRKPDEALSDDEALDVIRRGVKQRKDSIEQFEKGGRADLAASEKAELDILQGYLPASMPSSEIEAAARAKMAELGINDKSKAGQLVGALMKELKGKADGSEVKAVVDNLLT